MWVGVRGTPRTLTTTSAHNLHKIRDVLLPLVPHFVRVVHFLPSPCEASCGCYYGRKGLGLEVSSLNVVNVTKTSLSQQQHQQQLWHCCRRRQCRHKTIRPLQPTLTLTTKTTFQTDFRLTANRQPLKAASESSGSHKQDVEAEENEDIRDEAFAV